MDTEVTSRDFDALDAKGRLRLVWGFYWRNLVMTLAAAIAAVVVGGIVGFILGLVGSLLGFHVRGPAFQRSMIAVGALIGLGIGLRAFWFYVRWLFASTFSGLRLRLVKDSDMPQEPAAVRWTLEALQRKGTP